MLLKVGDIVEIKIIEPFDFGSGKLIGEIISLPGREKLLIKLSNPIHGKKFKSSIIELHPRYEEENFDLMKGGNDIMVNAALIENGSENFEFIVIGKMKIVS